jgi:hypothetical protein
MRILIFFFLTSQQKIFALTHRRVYILMANLFLNQFVTFFRKKTQRGIKISTRILDKPCTLNKYQINFFQLV